MFKSRIICIAIEMYHKPRKTDSDIYNSVSVHNLHIQRLSQNVNGRI